MLLIAQLCYYRKVQHRYVNHSILTYSISFINNVPNCIFIFHMRNSWTTFQQTLNRWRNLNFDAKP